MKLKTIIITIQSAVILAMPLQAEFVFLKNGSIIEGKIVTDAKDSISIRDKESKVVDIQRSNIIRVLYTSMKLGRIYIQKRDGEGLVAFMVDEDRDSYTFRKDLYKPEEFVIERSDVLFIAEKNPSRLKGVADTESIELTWLPPYDSVKSYNIYYSTDKKEKYKLAGNTWSKSYTLKGLQSNRLYFIIVTSVDSDGYESSPSNELKISTKNIPPDAPGNLNKKTTSDNKISISWDASIDKDGVVKEYKVLIKEKHQEVKELGKTAKTEYTIKGFEPKKIKQISVKAVDNNGDESLQSDFYGKPVVFTVRPLYANPSGKMKDLFSSGYGASLGFSVSDYVFDNSIINIETGFIRWSGNVDMIDGMNMFPSLFSLGYRFYIKEYLSISGTAGAGAVYMSTEYTNAAFVRTTSSAFESIYAGNLTIDYSITDNLTFSLGGGYYSIYEKSGMKSFAEAHMSINYRIF
ncbi:MAG: hypothetical protein CVV49_16370 [Spirochaetae bacterium HGW-Spirochaetae-5]|nr:MAG: hypothetical protein CVV49_16370 [Spirochaetae bacterium HGW-Spirochaetae-5]